jgi:hypothetical protein
MKLTTTRRRKPLREPVTCRGGPWAGQSIILTSPENTTAPFKVGSFFGYYKQGSWIKL